MYAPVVRIRRDNDDFFLTYKSKGMMVREEYNLPLTKESYYHLLLKADGRIITKTRYVIPIENGLFVELDIFEGDLAPLVLAEIEFPDEAFAKAYQAPSWLKGRRNLLFRISQQHPQQKRLKQETHRLQTMGSSPLSFDFSSYYRYYYFYFLHGHAFSVVILYYSKSFLHLLFLVRCTHTITVFTRQLTV